MLFHSYSQSLRYPSMCVRAHSSSRAVGWAWATHAFVRSFARSLAPLLDLSDLSFPFVPVVDVDDDDGDDDNHRGGGLLLV
jgi:hypothetical protein